MAELVVEGLVKTFAAGSVVAVDTVNIALESGKWLTLLGPSGCGKSTTLNCIAGLEIVTSGRIRIGSRLVVDGHKISLPPEDRNVGMVFQSYALWPHLNVAKNVGFPLMIRGMPAKQRAQQVNDVLNLVELTEMSDRYPHELSGGQQQRVALARALVSRPEILLLDEPLSNLDAKLRERARVWLSALQRELGITTVYVTHDQVDALIMSDEIAVMDAGKICQLGTPGEIYDHPASPFIADFIGTSNLIEGRLTARDERRGRIAVAGVEMTFNLSQGLEPEDRVFISIRPERIHVAMAKDSTGDTIRARPIRKIYLGSKYEYLMEVEGGELKVECTHPLPKNVDEVFLQIDPEYCTVFPRPMKPTLSGPKTS